MRRNQVREDHNYGEPGPSTLRHSQRLNQMSRQTSSTPVLEADPLEIPDNPALSTCIIFLQHFITEHPN